MESTSLSSMILLVGISTLCPKTGALWEHALGDPVLFGPSVALKEDAVDFYCEIPGEPEPFAVLYELFLDSIPERPISEHTSLSGEVATFPLVVKEYHDDLLTCRASGHNQTLVQSSYSRPIRLRVIVPVEGVKIVSHPSHLNLWEGQTLLLRCEIEAGSYVSYDWFVNGAVIESQLDRSNNTLMIDRLSAQHSGDYSCGASNQFNHSIGFNKSSDAIAVHVKEYISKPELEMKVVKPLDGGFKAVVTCRSVRGTPLNTFSLMNGSSLIFTETSDNTQAIFSIPIELNQEMGSVRCNASNQGNWVMSDPLSLTVESVRGAVSISLTHTHISQDFRMQGVYLRCSVEQGSFPQFRWFLNGSRLEDRGTFYSLGWSDHAHLSLALGRESDGFYRCEATDNFDNSSSISSTTFRISHEELNRVSPAVVLIVFSCFALIVIMVISCCVYGIILRKRYPRKQPLIERSSKRKATIKQDDEDDQEDEDYQMGFDEDASLEDRMCDSDQDGAESVDETVLYQGGASE
ncbi:hypothetical protein DNTS_032601 [Danionella cerebrum]|uniref:Ig-like domain-containing protein n=1 Tax=Danionella cerebrum TaxID=2873325 RepID=A0A553PYB5_9TELE|nr:hypothetical protein DNTS_032601 [Danionella translucida]